MSGERTVNVPLLRKAVEWAEAEAAKPLGEFCAWNQGSWITFHGCGTAYCIAGYVGQSLDARYAEAEVVEGKRVAQFAAEALGLDSLVGNCGQADCTCTIELFDACNDIADVRRIAEELAGERL